MKQHEGCIRGCLQAKHVLSKCRIEEGVNIDQFFFHLAKNYPNKSSIVMNMLGKKPVSEQSSSNEA